MFSGIVWSVELGWLDPLKDPVSGLHVGLCLSPFAWSAVSYVQWCLCSPQTERYRKTPQCMGPYHPSDVLHDQPRLAIFSRKRGNLSEIQRITLRASLGRPVCCVGKVRGANAQIVFSFHSFCRENLFALVITYNRCICFLFFFVSNRVSSTTFFSWTCSLLSVMLSDCARWTALIVYISISF